jgi:cell division protein FtsB
MHRTKQVNNNRIWEIGQRWGLLIGTTIVTISIFRNATLLVKSQNELNSAQKKLSTQQSEFDHLQETVAQMSTDTYQETIMRDKLGLAKEGEQVIFLPEDQTLIALSPPNTET